MIIRLSYKGRMSESVRDLNRYQMSIEKCNLFVFVYF